MPNHPHRASQRGSTPKGHIVMWLVACVLAFRAFVPVGFMPSVDALRDGRFVMTICTGTGGMRTVVVDSNGDALLSSDAEAARGPQSDGQDDPSMHLEQCPFGVAALSVGMPQAVSFDAAVSVVSVSPVIRFARDPALAPRSSRGPPLGSRAPPIRFV